MRRIPTGISSRFTRIATLSTCVLIALALAMGSILTGCQTRRAALTGMPDQTLPVLKIVTKDEGVYRVKAHELARAGLRDALKEHTHLRLSNAGQPVSFWLDDMDGEQVLSFYAEPVQSEFTEENVYILQSEDASPILPQSLQLITGTVSAGSVIRSIGPAMDPPAGSYYHTAHLEQNSNYLPQADESSHWLWQPLPVKKPLSLALPVNKPAAQDGARAVIRIAIWGATEAPANPDHRVIVSLNDQLVVDGSWDGKGEHLLQAELDASMLREGANMLTLETSGLGDVPAEVNYLDWIEIVYPRLLVAMDDRLELVATGDATTVRDFSGVVVVYDISEPGSAQRVETALERDQGKIAVTFASQPGNRYLAVGPGGALEPVRLEPLQIEPDLLALENSAGYIAVGPSDLLPPLQPLLDLRREQGLSPMAVPLQAVYDQFSHGMEDPQAIQRFMLHAQKWKVPPRFLLLVGDASYDPKNFLGGPQANRLPALMVNTYYGGQTASDAGFVQLNKDPWPDIPVGRVPAQTAEQVETFVQKTVEYEQAQAGSPGSRRVLAIADGQEESFAVYARLFLEDFPDGFETELLAPPAGEYPTKITRELSAGPLIAAYFGHGSMTMWGKDRLFTVEDVSNLESGASLPVVLNLTCLTGLFTHPKISSLAEALLFEPGKGAVAVLAPSSLTLADDQSFLTQPLVKAIADHPEYTLGELQLAARRQVDPSQPGQWDVMETFMLFGDPALRLPLR